ncbi:MAG TPA: hypothetical protein VN783_03320 [Thermoanaerobaculia bacterium]|nr:hypothetical protein [Thermoanaerobaculia bacterium]
MTDPRRLSLLFATLALTALAGCGKSPAPASGAAAPEVTKPDQVAAAPSPAPAEDLRPSRDELGTGREVAPPVEPPALPAVVPSPPPPAKAVAPRDLARERRLAQRERDLAARERRLRERENEAAQPAEPEPEALPADASEAEAPEAEAAAEPAAPELERAAPATVPTGTGLPVQLIGSLSSASSAAGDVFRARVAQDVVVDGEVAIPAGSEIQGLVDEAVSARRGKGGKARLDFRFTDLVLPTGETVPIHAHVSQIGKGDATRDAATVGGGAAAGAVLGHALAGRGEGGKGTLIGAIIGALAGAAIASRTAGEEIEVPEGTVLALKLDRPIEIDGGRP